MRKRNMNIKAGLAVGLVVLLGIAPITADAHSFGDSVGEDHFDIAPGVDLRTSSFANGDLDRSTQVLELNMNQTQLELSVPEPLGSLATTSDQAAHRSWDGHHVAGGVNASFMQPESLIVNDGSIYNLNMTLEENETGALYQMKAFGMGQDGSPHIGRYEASMSFNFDGGTVDVAGVNTGRKTGEAVVFTPHYRDESTGSSEWATEVVIDGFEKDSTDMAFGDELSGTVQEVRLMGEGGDSEIPDDGMVLGANGGDLADKLSGIEEGDQVQVSASINEPWADSEFMIATGPTLVEEGEVSISMNEDVDLANNRHPRTAVGYNAAEDRIFMATIDGRQSGYSDGATMRELSEYMISLGADYAINLDGGGSTTMVSRLDGYEFAPVVNRLSDGSERSVSTSLQAITSEPASSIDEQARIIETFGTTAGWEVSTARAEADLHDRASGEPSRIGPGAAKIEYDYSNGDNGTAAVYLERSHSRLLEGEPEQLGAWVYGDGEEHWLRAHVEDRNGETHTVDFTEENEMDWVGWRYVTAELPAGAHYPLAFRQMYTAQPSADKQNEGTIYVDQLEAIYDSEYEVERFPDVDDGSWAYESILRLNDRNVVTGFPDGTFRPSDSILREQAALMLTRETGVDTDEREDPGFNDVEEEPTFYDAIAAATEEGWIEGQGNNRFSPKANLTRAEMAAILGRVYDLEGESDEEFTDVDEGHWAYEDVQVLVANDLTSGYEDGSYRPDEAISRQEFSTFLDRLEQE
ncbi:S-layer homology domain-containing protein [Salsuginibacillus kocurii]|uniref:S-layer homology domain-containing protein n=1 Tax=Salsuginibacillus kocurii TaxID=427078 RepID=UPI000363F82D|nr:S-layer homology domain-containing protein [Salsuginibacillus kocurii]